MASNLLEATGLDAGYGRAEVLRGVGLRAGAGQVLTVIGPNGAGKTTLLAALMGLIPARGEIRFEDKPINALRLEERVDLGMAMVPETRALFTTMPVEDNLLLGGWRLGRQAGRMRSEELEKVYALFPRLRERRGQLAGKLSGGERQMLALGRALMGRPRLLMLDEPSLGLAPLVAREIFQIVARLRDTGVTVLLVEQNARAALAVADYGYVLEMGSVVLEGPAEQLAADPRIVDAYLGAQGNSNAGP